MSASDILVPSDSNILVVTQIDLYDPPEVGGCLYSRCISDPTRNPPSGHWARYVPSFIINDKPIRIGTIYRVSADNSIHIITY